MHEKDFPSERKQGLWWTWAKLSGLTIKNAELERAWGDMEGDEQSPAHSRSSVWVTYLTFMPSLRISQRGRLRQIAVYSCECFYTSKENCKNWPVWLQIFTTFRKVPDVDLVWNLVGLRPRKSQGFNLGAQGKRSQCPSSWRPARGNSVFHRQHLMWTSHIILDCGGGGSGREPAFSCTQTFGGLDESHQY